MGKAIVRGDEKVCVTCISVEVRGHAVGYLGKCGG